MNPTRFLLLVSLSFLASSAFAQPVRMDRLLFGVAYYDEYMQDGVFDFTHVGRVLAANQAVPKDSQQQLPPWGVMIVLEDRP